MAIVVVVQRLLENSYSGFFLLVKMARSQNFTVLFFDHCFTSSTIGLSNAGVFDVGPSHPALKLVHPLRLLLRRRRRRRRRQVRTVSHRRVDADIDDVTTATAFSERNKNDPSIFSVQLGFKLDSSC